MAAARSRLSDDNAYLEKSLINGKLDINNDLVYKNAYWERNINYDLDKSIVIVNNSPQRIVFSDDVVSRLAVSSGDSSSSDDGTQIGRHGTQIGGCDTHIGGHGELLHNSTHINRHYVQFQENADTGGQSHTDVGGQSHADDGGGRIHSNIDGQTVGGRSHTDVVDDQLVDILTHMMVVVALMVLTMDSDDNLDGESEYSGSDDDDDFGDFGQWDQVRHPVRRYRRRAEHLGPVVEPRLRRR